MRERDRQTDRRSEGGGRGREGDQEREREGGAFRGGGKRGSGHRIGHSSCARVTGVCRPAVAEAYTEAESVNLELWP